MDVMGGKKNACCVSPGSWELISCVTWEPLIPESDLGLMMSHESRSDDVGMELYLGMKGWYKYTYDYHEYES